MAAPIYTVTTVAELQTAAAAARSYNCVTNQTNFYIHIDNNLTINESVSIWAAGSSDVYRVIVQPTPGKGHRDLDKTGAFSYGSTGIEVTANVDSAIAIGRGARLFGLRLNCTKGSSLKSVPQGGGDGYPGVEGCKVKAEAWGAISSQAYQVWDFFNNLVIRSGAWGGYMLDCAWSIRVRGCTFVLLSGGTATGAHSGGWNNGAEMRSNIYYNVAQSSSGFYAVNNYTNLSGNAGSGMIVDTGTYFVNATNDFRPGGNLLGKAEAFLASTDDVRGNNRGPSPDVGAVQLNPSEALAVPTVTSQTFNTSNGTLTVSGTYVNNATTGTMTLVPQYNANGTPRPDPAVVSVDNTAKTFTVTMSRIARDLYKAPVVRLTNSGGPGPIAPGTTPITNYDKIPAAAVANASVVQPRFFQPKPATEAMGLTKKVEHVRNGSVIATYSELGDLLCNDARYGNPTIQVQSGDLIRVYPAVYKKAVWFGGFGGAILENVQVVGITQNGVRPAIRWSAFGTGYGYDSGYGSGNGIMYIQRNKDCTWDNIDVLWNGGYLAKALVYCFNQSGGTVTLKNMRIMGAYRSGENGFLSAAGSNCNLIFENVESGYNGGDGGAPPQGGGNSLAHGYYITRHDIVPETGLRAKVTFRGCYFHNAWRGHLLKCRHNNVLIEGCYFAGTPPSVLQDTSYGDYYGPFTNDGNNIGHASNIDMPNGGAVTIRNCIFTKNYTGFEQGTFFFNWAAETSPSAWGSGNETDPAGRIEIYNNTFVSYSDVTTTYNTGTSSKPTPYGLVYGTAVEHPDWNLTLSPVLIADNVYAGVIQPTYMEPTAQILTLDEINLPGRDTNAVPFSPKTPQGSTMGNGGKGSAMYAYKALSGERLDSNKGAVGTYTANITAASGVETAPMWTPVRNSTQAGYVAAGFNTPYPLQVEWVTYSGTATNGGGGAAPTISVASITANGRKVTIAGTVNTQGDAGATVVITFVPVAPTTGSNVIALNEVTANGSFSKQVTIPSTGATYKAQVSITANGQQSVAESNSFSILRLTGSPKVG